MKKHTVQSNSKTQSAGGNEMTVTVESTAEPGAARAVTAQSNVTTWSIGSANTT